MNWDYPSPKTDERFNFYWDKYIDNVVERDNFKTEHLDQLAVLCQMYVDLEECQEDIEAEGRTYKIVGRNGAQIKCHPLVAQINTLRTEIRNYNKALGLTLERDRKMKDTTSKNEWTDEGEEKDNH